MSYRRCRKRSIDHTKRLTALSPLGRPDLTLGAAVTAHKIGGIIDSRPTSLAPLDAVTVVIPILRDPSRLAPTIAVLAEDPIVHEVIVVDDRRGDGHDRLEPFVAGWVRTLRTGGVGPSLARQHGLEAASGSVVLMLDEDVLPNPGLASGHAAHHATSGLVVVGHMPVAEPQDPSSEPLPAMLYRREYAARVAEYQRDPATILLHLWSGNVSMRRADAVEVGLTSPVFRGRRHEDRDLGLRCLGAGMIGVFDRSLGARHDYERSNRRFLDDARAQGAERVWLHRIHADLVGPLDERASSANLPVGLAALVRACRHPTVESVVTGALTGALAIAELTGSRRAELPLLKLARRVQQQAGAGAAEREIANAGVTL